MFIESQLITGTRSLIQRADMMIEKESLEKQLAEEIESDAKTIVGRVLEMHKNFKHLCINLARADGQMNMIEINELNVMDFYFLKQNVHDLHKRTKKNLRKDGE